MVYRLEVWFTSAENHDAKKLLSVKQDFKSHFTIPLSTLVQDSIRDSNISLLQNSYFHHFYLLQRLLFLIIKLIVFLDRYLFKYTNAIQNLLEHILGPCSYLSSSLMRVLLFLNVRLQLSQFQECFMDQYHLVTSPVVSIVPSHPVFRQLAHHTFLFDVLHRHRSLLYFLLVVFRSFWIIQVTALVMEPSYVVPLLF